MTVIYKKQLSLQNGTDQLVELPKSAQVVSAREQHNVITIWFECNPDDTLAQRRFQLVLTGAEVGVGAGIPAFCGTCLLDGGRFVVHVYEIVSAWY